MFNARIVRAHAENEKEKKYKKHDSVQSPINDTKTKTCRF